eukprot:1190574-Prorocentrum_minimum.AAC.3
MSGRVGAVRCRCSIRWLLSFQSEQIRADDVLNIDRINESLWTASRVRSQQVVDFLCYSSQER